MLLQSSVAVVLLIASFVSTGTIGFSSALSTVIGADLGSALIVLLLSFQINWLMPLCLSIGGWLYIKTNTTYFKKTGKALIGIGLILLSLQLLAEAFEPIRNSELWPSFVVYLENDLLTAFLLGAALAFFIHSSVAAILMCVALVEYGAIPMPIGVALTLGANLGSSLIPIWLTRDFATTARRIVIGNFLIRGTIATLTFFIFTSFGATIEILFDSPGKTLIAVHVGFNAMLLMALPFIKMLEPMLKLLLPSPTIAADPIAQWRLESSLVEVSRLTPALALANIRREILRMSEFVSAMALPALNLYQHSTSSEYARVHEKELALNDVLANVRHYSAKLPYESMSNQERSELRELLDTAIDLTAAGGIIASRLGTFAQSVQSQHIHFSDAGWDELVEINRIVMENMALAFGALAADDTSLAREVIEAKSQIHQLQRSSRKYHFERLCNGQEVSFDSSDIHLETLYALKDFNAKITDIVYPILSRNGHLVERRFVQKNTFISANREA